MPYSLATGINLGSGYEGLSLEATLVDTNGQEISGQTHIRSGFSEVSDGIYLWYYTGFPDGFTGGIKILQQGTTTVIVFIAINPQDSEYTDVKTSSQTTILTNYMSVQTNNLLNNIANQTSSILDSISSQSNNINAKIDTKTAEIEGLLTGAGVINKTVNINVGHSERNLDVATGESSPILNEDINVKTGVKNNRISNISITAGVK